MRKCERVQLVIGLDSSAIEDVGHEHCGWRFERGSPVRNARVKNSVFDCDGYIERTLLAMKTHTRPR